MLVAVCDQNFGNSTPRCSNAGPLRPGIRASRVSHSISSKGSRPGIVKKRRTPRRAPSSVTVLTTSSVVGSVVFCCSTLAISAPSTVALLMCSDGDVEHINSATVEGAEMASVEQQKTTDATTDEAVNTATEAGARTEERRSST